MHFLILFLFHCFLLFLFHFPLFFSLVYFPCIWPLSVTLIPPIGILPLSLLLSFIFYLSDALHLSTFNNPLSSLSSFLLSHLFLSSIFTFTVPLHSSTLLSPSNNPLLFIYKYIPILPFPNFYFFFHSFFLQSLFISFFLFSHFFSVSCFSISSLYWSYRHPPSFSPHKPLLPSVSFLSSSFFYHVFSSLLVICLLFSYTLIFCATLSPSFHSSHINILFCLIRHSLFFFSSLCFFHVRCFLSSPNSFVFPSQNFLLFVPSQTFLQLSLSFSFVHFFHFFFYSELILSLLFHHLASVVLFNFIFFLFQ